MTCDEFRREFVEFLKKAVLASVKTRREGLLALEEDLKPLESTKHPVFERMMYLVIDGTDHAIIDKIASNIVNREKDEYAKLFRHIQKEAILAVQEGMNVRMLVILLNSYTDIPIDECFKMCGMEY